MAPSPIQKWMMTVTATLGVFAVVLEGTILTVALPRLMAHYTVEQGMAQWLITGFLAATTATMLLSAWCLARFGMRRTFIGALGAFAVASAIAALGPPIGWLIAARVVQGAMTGLVQPLGMIILVQAFPVEERGRGLGIYGLGVVLAPAVAPILGGLMVDLWSWQAVFLVALPPAAVAALMAVSTLAPLDAEPDPEAGRRLDLFGLGLLTATLTVVLWALARGPRAGWSDPLALAALAAGIVGAVGFVLWQRGAMHPLLDLRAFASGPFASGFTASVLIGAGLYGSTYLIPLFLQQVGGMDASTAGLVMLPAGLAMALAFPVAGTLADRAAPATVAGIGMVAFVASCGALAWSRPADLGVGLVMMVLVGRVGLGLMMPSVSAAAMRALPQVLTAQGAGAMNFGRQLGGALGVGFASVMVQLGTPSPQALQQGYRAAFVAVALLLAVGAAPLWRLHRSKAR